MNYINKINKRIYQIKLIVLLTFGVTLLAKANVYTIQYIANVDQLGQPLFIASLELMSTDKKQRESKRMTVKLVTEKWSPRRFKKWWMERLYLNNEITMLDSYLIDIKDLFSSIKEPLTKGDVIVVEYKKNNGTVISINEQKVLANKGQGVFTLFVNTWVGSKPPSSEFKAVMTGEMASREKDVISFAGIKPSENRKRQVAGWLEPEKLNTELNEESILTQVSEMSEDGSNQAVVEPLVEAVSRISTFAEKKELDQPVVITELDKEKKLAIENPVSIVMVNKTLPAQREELTNQQQISEQLRLKNEYRNMITKSIVRHINYPTKDMIAKKMRSKRYSIPEGVVVLGLRVNRLGKLLATEELVAADTESLNRLAMTALDNANLPSVPSELVGDVIELSLPIRFQGI